jgi:hypothetical protein
LIVSLITLGPAKPMSAPGSAIFKSPSIPKIAEIPPKVGSVRSDINGKPAYDSCESLPLVFASCLLGSLWISSGNRDPLTGWSQDQPFFLALPCHLASFDPVTLDLIGDPSPINDPLQTGPNALSRRAKPPASPPAQLQSIANGRWNRRFW